MKNVTHTEKDIRALLAEITLNRDFLSSPGNTSLSQMGLDSVGMIEFIYALEDRFQLQLAEEEVVPENFQSIQSITHLVERKNAIG